MSRFKWIVLVVSIIVVLPGVGSVDGLAKEKPGWQLVFEDEFDGDAIDQTVWNILPLGQSVAVRRDGFWAKSEAFLDGEGHLIIQTSERNGNYYSGAINTQGKFEKAYGYYEIRAQLPKGEGLWGAFWLWTPGVLKIGSGGREGTEIDIFESMYYTTEQIQLTLNWDGYDEHHKAVGHRPRVPGIFEGFHTFAVDWNEDEYIFYIDDVEMWRTSGDQVSEAPSYMKVTMEVAEWAGDISKTDLPVALIVDYVRVYERIHDFKILAPERHAIVMADEPIELYVNPDVDVREIWIEQNGVEIYRGPQVPEVLTLSGPVVTDGEQHTLTVYVTDGSGETSSRSTPIFVRRVALDLLDDDQKGGVAYVRGNLDIDAEISVADHMIAQVDVLIESARTDVTSAAHLVYSDVKWSGPIVFDTVDLDNGAYDVVFHVTTVDGDVATDRLRIVVSNRVVLNEPFNPPVTFFGVTLGGPGGDSLKTQSRSDGWELLSDDPHLFFEDSQRIGASVGAQEEYLLWKHQSLERFELVAYAKDGAVLELLETAVSKSPSDGSSPAGWTSVAFDIEQVEQHREPVDRDEPHDSEWKKFLVTGTMVPEQGNDLFRLSVPEGIDKTQLQFGSLSLIGLTRIP